MIEIKIDKSTFLRLLKLFQAISETITIHFERETIYFYSPIGKSKYVKCELAASDVIHYSPDQYIGLFTIDTSYWYKVIKPFTDPLQIMFQTEGEYARLLDEERQQELRINGYAEHEEFTQTFTTQQLFSEPKNQDFRDFIELASRMEEPSELRMTVKGGLAHLETIDKYGSVLRQEIPTVIVTDQEIRTSFFIQEISSLFEKFINRKTPFAISLTTENHLYFELKITEDATFACQVIFAALVSE